MTTSSAARQTCLRTCLLLLLLAFLTPAPLQAERVRMKVINYSPHPVIYCLATWHGVKIYGWNTYSGYRSHSFDVRRLDTGSRAPGMSRLVGIETIPEIVFNPQDGSNDRIDLGLILCFDNDDDRDSFHLETFTRNVLSNLVGAIAPRAVEMTSTAVATALYQVANGRARPSGVSVEDVAGLIGGAELEYSNVVYIRGRIAPSLVGDQQAKEVLRRELILGINASFPPAFADVTGEGLADFCRSSSDPGGATQIVCTPAERNGFTIGSSREGRPDTDAGYSWFPQTFADVNGDSRADFCRGVGDPRKPFIACDLAADGFGGTTQYAFRSRDGIHLGYDWFPRAFVDVNADGHADFCRLAGNPLQPFISCNLAEIHGFAADQNGFRSATGIALGEGSFPRQFADVNGDRKADFCRLVKTPEPVVRCLLAGRNGFDGGEIDILQSGDTGYDWFPRVFVDVNNDRRADFCRAVGNPNAPFIACALTGAPRADQYKYRSEAGIALGTDDVDARFPRVFADINGDGRADFVRMKSRICNPGDCLVWTFAAESGFDASTRSSTNR